MKHAIVFVLGCSLAAVALAKLPPPGEEAAAKAAEAAAKAAWSGKVAGYKLCKVQDRVAADYFKTAKAAGKAPLAAVETPPCVEPPPFVYTPAAAAPAVAAPAPASAVPATAAKS